MALANAHYYATRDPLGVAGDFVTAPEISQMFGELVGLCLADLWQRSGRPDAAWVELGPGRGTLTADALRAMAVAGLRPAVHFVETSPVLRDIQRARLPDATWHENVGTLPDDRPLLIVANEFFDALPVRQRIRGARAWHERVVDRDGRGFVARASDVPLDAAPDDSATGTIAESCPAALAIVERLAKRLVAQGGALLAIDYGPIRSGFGDTLQAVRAHVHADPFGDPGERDLTAHVDFAALAAAATRGGARTHGPVEQGQWLVTLGIAGRAAALARGAPAQADAIGAAYRRLTAPDAMGRLFKVLAAVAPGWPEPAGFL